MLFMMIVNAHCPMGSGKKTDRCSSSCPQFWTRPVHFFFKVIEPHKRRSLFELTKRSPQAQGDEIDREHRTLTRHALHLNPAPMSKDVLLRNRKP